jgi:hypothetical protein
MPEYVAALSALSRKTGTKLIPHETAPITAETDDEAVQKAIKWRTSTFTTTNGRTWLEVFREGESKAFHSKEIGRI